MLVPPVRLSTSLGLAWAYARRRAGELADAFGLGPLAVHAFVTRAIHKALDRELTGLEALVRRVLFIAAMETPLPRWTGPVGVRKTARAPPRPVPDAVEEAEPPARRFRVPDFRLIEPVRVPRRDREDDATPDTGDRLPEPHNAPRPFDYVPAARLFDRFSALRSALADPERQVARFRQKLARIRADKTLPLPLADKPPPACTGPKTRPVARELYWALHDAALSWLPLLDTG